MVKGYSGYCVQNRPSGSVEKQGDQLGGFFSGPGEKERVTRMKVVAVESWKSECSRGRWASWQH